MLSALREPLRPPRPEDSWVLKVRWFVVHGVLHADDTPHRLALGLAIGLWVSLMPIIGAQMVTSAAICHPFRANKAVAMAMAWVTNPVTIVPIFLPCYGLGCWLLDVDPLPRDQFAAIFFPAEEGAWARVAATWQAMTAVFAPLWLGCALVATAVSVPAYFLVERGITAYRARPR